LGSDLRAERPEEFGAIAWLLQNSAPAAESGGAQNLDNARKSNWVWPWAEQIAAAWMHLGCPTQARRIWRAALDPPSEAERFCRIAASYAAAGNWREASQLYLRAARLAPEMAEPRLGLAILHLQAGRADSARDECRQALQKACSDYEREHLQSFIKLLGPRD
jgi:tetratricopeptide (TPR) repeat protein